MHQGKQFKRPRKTNWSSSEITVLTEKVEEKLDLIRSKFSNSVTNAKKNAAWLEITEAVNAVGVAYRTVQEVRDKWKNLTSTTKEEFSDFGKEQRKTGDRDLFFRRKSASIRFVMYSMDSLPNL